MAHPSGPRPYPSIVSGKGAVYYLRRAGTQVDIGHVGVGGGTAASGITGFNPYIRVAHNGDGFFGTGGGTKITRCAWVVHTVEQDVVAGGAVARIPTSDIFTGTQIQGNNIQSRRCRNRNRSGDGDRTGGGRATEVAQARVGNNAQFRIACAGGGVGPGDAGVQTQWVFGRHQRVHSSTRPIGPGALAAVLRTAPVCVG